MKHSESVVNLLKALAAAQGEFRPAPKRAENPHFKSSYADLAGVWETARPVLAKHSLCVTQMPYVAVEGLMLETTLWHVSGEFVSGVLPVAADYSRPQAVGAALTYMRRYGLQAVLGLVAEGEGDDGNLASGRAAPEPAAARAQVPARNGRHAEPAGQPPYTGKALFAWVKEQEQRYEVGLLKYLNQWAKLMEFPARMADWDAERVGLAHAEACRKLQAVGSRPQEATEEAPAPAGEAQPSRYREWLVPEVEAANAKWKATLTRGGFPGAAAELTNPSRATHAIVTAALGAGLFKPDLVMQADGKTRDKARVAKAARWLFDKHKPWLMEFWAGYLARREQEAWELVKAAPAAENGAG